MIVVSNTTPLRYLIAIGEIDILRPLYGQVLIPPSVAIELSHDRTPVQVQNWLANCPTWLVIRSPLTALTAAPSMLGAGEKDAITLAEELKADVLLMDDWHARREAGRRQISVQGTLGLLVLAAKYGLTDLPKAIDRLRRTNFRASEKLLRSALRQITP